MKKSTAAMVGIVTFIALQTVLIIGKVPAYVDLVACGIFANNLLWFAILKWQAKHSLQALQMVGQVAGKSSDNLTTVAMGGLQVAAIHLQVSAKDLQTHLQAKRVKFNEYGQLVLPDGQIGQVEII
jgi:hypothetical protein